MPCIDNSSPQEIAEYHTREKRAITGPLYEEIGVLKAELAERESMLCGVMMALYRADGYHASQTGTFRLVETMRDWFNEDEAGVSYDELQSWWTEHQKKDQERKAREAAELENRRRRALKKLTLEERVLLGLPGKLP